MRRKGGDKKGRIKQEWMGMTRPFWSDPQRVEGGSNDERDTRLNRKLTKVGTRERERERETW